MIIGRTEKVKEYPTLVTTIKWTEVSEIDTTYLIEAAIGYFDLYKMSPDATTFEELVESFPEKDWEDFLNDHIMYYTSERLSPFEATTILREDY